MKRLPCSYCKSGNAAGPASTAFPKGEPLLIGRIPSNDLFYKCQSCKRVNRKTPVQIAQLPEASGVDVDVFIAVMSGQRP